MGAINHNQIESLLESLSFLILDYTDGDLLCVSQLMDTLADLRELLEKKEPDYEIARAMAGLLSILVKGETVPDAKDTLAEGTDLLSRIAKEKKRLDSHAIPESLKKEAMQYNSRNSGLLAPGTESTGKKEKNTAPAADNQNLVIHSEAFRIFISEADEKLIAAQDMILTLEREPANRAIIADLFRIFHTIKGESGFLRLASFGDLAHSLENVLDLLRTGELVTNPEIISILLKGIDCANEILSNHKKGTLTIIDNTRLTDLKRLIEDKVRHVKESIGEILVDAGKLSDADVVSILQIQKESSFTKKFGEIAVEENFISREEIDATLEKQKTGTFTGTKTSEEKLDPIIKVKASQINFLVDMIGELIIAENQLDDWDRRVVQLKKITREIQNGAMQLRTTKVRNLFLKMKRVVRDLSLTLGKKVELETVGTELEIDRNLVENLEEPLMHLLRNCVDHGIESKDERLTAGKPETGAVLLKAERRGNSIMITVEDDGKGLDRDKLLAKAKSMKIVSEETAAGLKDEDIYNFIFVQGFTTAGKVDHVSGRGVGMDIVRSVVSSSKGRIEIKTECGKYTRFGLVFPLSTAIIDGMIVRNSEIWYVVPVHNIIESLAIEDSMLASISGKAKVIDLRQEIIPLIELNDYFNTGSAATSADGRGTNENGTGQNDVSGKNGNREKIKLGIIVENSEKKKFALLVDEIVAKKEVVIKTLGNKFKRLKGISSGTVLSGGKIGFVLDIDQVVASDGARMAVHA